MTCCIVLDGGEKIFALSYDEVMKEISHQIMSADRGGLTPEATMIELRDVLGAKVSFPLTKLNHFFQFDASKAGDIKGEEDHGDEPDIDYSTDQS